MDSGAQEYFDIKAAALWLMASPGVDSSGVGIWGLSYGGLNALQACARDSPIFKACVAVSGMFNWISSSRYFTDTGLKIIDDDIQPSLPKGFRSLDVGPEPAWVDLDWVKQVRRRQEISFMSSPAGHVENWTSPTLMIHGDADEEVDFQEAIGCARKFRALGRTNIEVQVFPDENHGCLAAYSHLLRHTEAMLEFLKRHISPGLDLLDEVVV
jgi:dipeptidyl aminopeptidase/acylaminoacyl peptidase